MITVKPAQGKMIRDPLTQQFVDPDKGLRVDESDTYWRRRLRDGDVVKADESPSASATTTKAAKASTGASGASASGAGATGSGA